MKINKLSFSLLLLFFITIAISFYPNILNAKKETTLLNTKEYWDLSQQNESTLTASELAYYVSTQTLTGSTLDAINMSGSDAQNSNTIRETSLKIWDHISSEYPSLNSYILPILHGDIEHYESDTILTIIKNTPMTLSFVDTVFVTDTGSIALVYEEKTRMINHFFFHQVDQPINPDVLKSLFDDFNQIAHEYYVNQLGLSPSQYYYQTSSYDDSLYISFGINLLDKAEIVTD